MVEPRRVELVALLDVSGSMAIDAKRAVAVDALRRIGRRWHDLGATAAVIARVWMVTVGQGRTPPAESIPLGGLGPRLDELEADGRLLPGGRGGLAQTIRWASMLEATSDDARRALVLLSDGHDGAPASEHLSGTPSRTWSLRCAVAAGADADIEALRTFAGEQGVVVEPAAVDRVAFALDALAWDDRPEAVTERLTALGVPGPDDASTSAPAAAGSHVGDTATAPPVEVQPLRARVGHDSGRTVTDTSGIVHFLVEQLSEGGEGTVYTTRDPRVGVKVLHEAVRDDRLATVRRLPLDGLQIARPGASLVDEEGYVMRFLTGMDTLEARLGTDLRRSLRILGNVAGVLAALHARGLVHRDVKPSNVLVSEAPQRTLVWLIDADNIANHGEPDRPVYTRGFDAPEGPQGDWFCDRFALSVLVHRMLTGRHPWLGNAQPYDSWQQDWCQEPGLARDVRNEGEGEGRPLAAVTDQRMRELAGMAFGLGLADPPRRPAALDWAQALHAAADLTLTCEAADCQTSYFAGSRACPVCATPRGRVTLVRLHRVAPGGAMPAAERPDSCLALRRHDEAWITERHLLSSVPAGMEETALLRVNVEGSRLRIRRTGRGAESQVELRTGTRKRPRSARPPRERFGRPQPDIAFRLADGDAVMAGLLAGPAVIPQAIVAEQTHA